MDATTEHKLKQLEAEITFLKRDLDGQGEDILLVPDVMKIMKVKCEEAIYKAIKNEGLPMRKKAGKWRIRRKRLIEWLDGDSY